MRLEDKKLVDKLIQVEKHLSTRKGPFDLFALILREELSDKWDLLVAADWIENNFDQSLKLISRELTKKLSSEELSTISKVVLLSIFDQRVKSVQKAIQIEHLDTELVNVGLFGFFVDRGYLITSKRRIDERLKELTWKVVLEEWKKAKKAISSDEVFEKVSARRKKVSPKAVNKVIDYLVDKGCIRGSFIDFSSAPAPRSILITSVNPNCSPSSVAAAL
jgi:hypothetical protein